MAYYWLHFKDRQDRVTNAFLLEHKDDHAAWAQATTIDRGELGVALWEGERLVAFMGAKPTAALQG